MIGSIRRFLSPAASRALVSAVAIGSIGVLANCTLVTSRSNGQCFNDGDCRSRGAAFANTRCSAAGVCEVVSLPDAGPAEQGPCATNAECNTRLSQPARCTNGECVAIGNTGTCTTIDGDPTAADALFMGVLTPRSGANAAFGLNQYDVIRAAAAEWSQNAASNPGAHPVVLIGCDEMADPVGATSFLSDNARVAAIFGPIFDSNFELAAPVATLSGTFILAPRADDPNLSAAGGLGKTVWSYAPNRKIQEKLFNNLVATIEPSVKTMFTISGDMKLAMVVATGDPSSKNFADDVEKTLMFNGKTKDANGANYVRVDVPFSFAAANDYSSVVTALVTAAPDLVVLTQEYDLLTLVRAINSGWTGAKFPRFLLLTDDPSVDNETGIANEKFAGKVDLMTWAKNATETTNATAFAVSYHTANNTDPASGSESLYDSFYENGYAIQALLKANGDAVALLDPGAYSDAIKAFNGPGTTVSVGTGTGSPNNIAQALNIIANGQQLDLEGASGPLQFDVTTGTPLQTATLQCLKKTPAGVSASGVTFDPTTGAASGTYSCL